jgi:hypothetical protein
VFVSYAHSAARRVFPIIEGVSGSGFSIWYDTEETLVSSVPIAVEGSARDAFSIEIYKPEYMLDDGAIMGVYDLGCRLKRHLSDDRHSRRGLPDQKNPALPFSRTCIPKGGKIIRARELSRNTKVFSDWDREKYFYGRAGDYIAAPEADFKDAYIINREIFEMTYCSADEP